MQCCLDKEVMAICCTLFRAHVCIYNHDTCISPVQYIHCVYCSFVIGKETSAESSTSSTIRYHKRYCNKDGGEWKSCPQNMANYCYYTLGCLT